MGKINRKVNKANHGNRPANAKRRKKNRIKTAAKGR